MAYIRGHCEYWWTTGFAFLKGYPPWMRDIGEDNWISGFRASEVGVYLLVLDWRLKDLDVEKDKSFSEWRSYKAKMSESDWKVGLSQNDVFVGTARASLAKHGKVFRNELVDLAIDHPDRRLGVAMTQTLLCIYDDEGRLLLFPKVEIK